MADTDAPILPLPPEVVKKVQSSVKITNLNGVVVELTKNALDAGAGSISIVVDYRRGGCIVEDDGYGLPAAEFMDGSGLCRPHRKFYSDVFSLHVLTVCRYLESRQTISV
jgi:DNA mismatch repair protein MLH3